MSLSNRLFRADMDVCTLRRLTGVSVRTVQRWERQDAWPVYVDTVIGFYGGWLPWPLWEHCRIQRGYLFIDGYPRGVTPNEIANAAIAYQRLDVIDGRDASPVSSEPFSSTL